MTFIDNFYLSDDITEDRKKIIKRLNNLKKCLSYYLLTISDIKDGMIDIIPAIEVSMWPAQYQDQLVVIGVSKGPKQASEMVASMVTEIYDECGNYNIKAYFENKITSNQVK